MRSRFRVPHLVIIFALSSSLLLLSATARPFVLVLSKDDLKDTPPSDDDSSADSSDWDEFGESETQSEEELDPGSWRPIVDSSGNTSSLYFSAVRSMISAAATGDPRSMEEAASEIEAAAAGGSQHAQSALGFLYGTGCTKEQSASKAFLYHHFAAEGGNKQSKMALAYTYLRQEVWRSLQKTLTLETEEIFLKAWIFWNFLFPCFVLSLLVKSNYLELLLWKRTDFDLTYES